MKIFGRRVWPWHKMNWRAQYVRWAASFNYEGGLTITLFGWSFFTSDETERRKGK